MIEAVGVVRRYGDVVALHPTDVHLEAGERVAVLGDNGAGKTTLLRIIAAVARPDAGSVRLFGLDPRRERERVLSRLGYLAHQTGLFPQLCARENLEFFCRLRGLPLERATAVLEAVGLAGAGGAAAGGLSRGMQQRLAIARTLLHDPELLVLDEPDASLDAAGRALLEVVCRARTVVIATHDRDLASRICDRALTLRAGRVLQVAGAVAR